MSPASPLARTEDASPLAWRELSPSDIDALENLHRLSIGAVVRPDVVKPETRDFFESILGGRGRVFGVFAPDAELVAYGILQHGLAASDDPRADLDLAADLPMQKLAGAGVSPLWRGQGLQRALIAARVRAASIEATLFSTAAPANEVSLANLLNEGFSVRALVSRYGGLLRYLLVRDPGGNPPPDGFSSREVGLADLDTQRNLLAQSWEAVALLPATGHERTLRFAPGARAAR